MKKPTKKTKRGKRKASRALTVRADAAMTRPKTIAEVCFAAAKDKDIDVAKMRELMQFATEQEWTNTMLAVQNEIGERKIIKDAWNPHTKSHYPKLENIQKVVDPIIRKHGFTLSFGMADSPLDDHYRIICDVRHTSGHTKRYEADIGMDTTGPKGGGTKSAAQGSGSSISYGRRYLMTLIFNLTIAGEDKDGASRKQSTIDATQLAALTDLLEGDERLTDQFLTAYSIKSVEQLPAAKYDEAFGRVKNAKAHRKPRPAETAEAASE